ncbi:MAG: radical SAM protein, partial [Alkalinema sp. CAN_BIN05]|nr:radical SAM protein [Alkalinema sp. CAN_BIN05]
MNPRILYVRLPCNPIFPIGVVYLADHVHKLFPEVEQRIFDLGTVPPLDYSRSLDQAIDEFRPTLTVYSWRDIQIYAPVGGRGGNPLQNAFEFFYSKNLLLKLRGALGGAKMLAWYYGELWRNRRLIARGVKRARRYVKTVTTVVGGGAVSVFYEQLGDKLPKGTIVSVGEGESLLERLVRGESLEAERCYVAGMEKPRERLIHELPKDI